MTGLVLGIETSGASPAVALVRDSKVVFESSGAPGTHNETLLFLIRQALTRTGCSLADLNGIGVAAGPGMFTSLRVGLSTAKAIAIVNTIPLAGVNTLDALASSPESSGGIVLGIIDARKGEFYYSLYRDGSCYAGPAVAGLEGIGDSVMTIWDGESPVLLVGDGARQAVAVLKKRSLSYRLSSLSTPRANSVARIAALLIAAGNSADPDSVVPSYLRRTDAELRRDLGGAGQPGAHPEA